LTIGLQRDGGEDDDEEKTTVRSVPDGSDKDVLLSAFWGLPLKKKNPQFTAAQFQIL